MPLHGIDHVELWVGNAQQAAYFYAHAFGFREVAYAGLETGVRDRASHVLEQGRIRLVLTGALHSDSPIAAHQRKHGDGVKVIALCVPDVDHAYREATDARRRRRRRAARGRRRARHGPPRHDRDLRRDAAHVRRPRRLRRRLPARLRARRGRAPRTASMLLAIDHIVGNVELGAMETWVKYYEDVFGMTEMIHFSDEAISTEYSALMSKVVTDGNGRVKFPINEPAEGKRKSQIDEYLEFYGGPGAQHIAVATRDIVGTVTELRRRGVEFLTMPAGLLRRGARARARGRASSSTTCASWASSSTATTRATCCRSSPSRSATARRCSSRSSSATARAASARATSRRCSRRSSASRSGGGTSRTRCATSAWARSPPSATSRRGATAPLLVEEVLGYEGFSGNESILYHLHSPCRLSEVGEFTPIEREEWVPDTHVHRLTDTNPVDAGRRPGQRPAPAAVQRRRRGAICKPTEADEGFYRDGEGDEVVFVHHGERRAGDDLRRAALPRARLRRDPARDDLPLRAPRARAALVCFHTPGEIETPNRYRNRYGQLLEHAPFSQRDFHPPAELETDRGAASTTLTVRVRGGYQDYVLDYHPFDVVGWDGYVYPYTFNADDFEPQAGRLHQPPPAHQTFQGPNFVICSFCPRMLDWDATAVPLPYHHSNVQSEEVMYYVDGDFASRKGVDVGCITLHPSGLPHGPQPGTVEKALGAKRPSELAVMCDTFRPLKLTTLWRDLDDPAYAYSWYEEKADASRPSRSAARASQRGTTAEGPSGSGPSAGA